MVFLPFVFHKRQRLASPQVYLNNEKVSIVIAFKNEEENLEQCLDSLLNQKYPNFEIILIDDHSTDSGSRSAIDLAEKHEHLKYYSLEKLHGKKAALSLGVSKATGTWIALTDADCYAGSDSWLQKMMAHSVNADVVLGYGPYRSENSFINLFIRYETWHIALQYMSFSILRIYYMAVGRNMFFKKSLFDQMGGYQEHQDLLSGSDDLFMANVPKNAKVQYCTDEQSYIYSYPKRSWKELYNQKRRHLSTSIHYRLSAQIILGIISLSQLLLYISGLLLIFQGFQTTLVASFMLVRVIYIWIIAALNMHKIIEKRLWVLSPLFDFLIVFYYFSFSFTLFFKIKRW
jgi:glycosyltransferase involved in cell wall biosynthesis